MSREVSLSDRMLQVLPSAVDSPEDALIRREDEPERPRRGPRPLHPDRKLLKRLPPDDVDILRLAFGHDAASRQVGKLHRISKTAVNKRLISAQRRIAWLRGPGSLFTAIDLNRDTLWRLMPEDRKMLVSFWRLRNTREVAKLMGLCAKTVRLRTKSLVENELVALANEDAERYGKYLRGFRALRCAITAGGSLFLGM